MAAASGTSALSFSVFDDSLVERSGVGMGRTSKAAGVGAPKVGAAPATATSTATTSGAVYLSPASPPSCSLQSLEYSTDTLGMVMAMDAASPPPAPLASSSARTRPFATTNTASNTGTAGAPSRAPMAQSSSAKPQTKPMAFQVFEDFK